MRKFIAFIFILFSIYVFTTSLTGSFKIGYSVDFSQEPIARNFYYDLWFNLNSSGMGFSFNSALHWDKLDSFEAYLNKDDLWISVYNNRIFSNSFDSLLFYKFDSGQYGMKFSYKKFNAFYVLSSSLHYYTVDFSFLKLLYGIREGVNDILVEFNYRSFLNFFGEGVLTATTPEGSPTEFGYYFFLVVSEPSMKWGVKFYKGDNPNTPSYTALNKDYSDVFNFWFNENVWKVWGNFYLNDALSVSDLGFRYENKSLWIELYKKGFDDFSVDLNKMKNFYVSVGTSFEFLGFRGKAFYTFGKPVHNTVGTIGDLYYLELGRSFGNIHFFAKTQYIYGYYERRWNLYGELKWTGFSNAELKLILGNGDFYYNNTFKPVLTMEINSWW